MKKISKLLVANRGEIAVRIIRAARQLNIATVAIYSTVDFASLHVMLADEVICIGNHQLKNSYLNQEAILQAAINTKANAIHPGFGFLSENASFAKKCETLNIKFIGPSSKIIETMGDKVTARQTMISANVPVVLGSKDLINTYTEALKLASEIGYPVIVKATAGGGGKGMRICYSDANLKSAFEAAKNEALLAFNNDDVYIEKFIENPRHIEVQILGDSFGNVRHLFERECSVQRNNQKMIEEAPVANLSKKTRESMLNVCVAAAKMIGYESAGTFEFIMDDQENYYFIEMNTRIQVEHPVSELISGIDIVKEQIKIAQGEKISFKQSDVTAKGHAIEIRINAENPKKDFLPSAGLIKSLHFPGGNGVRIDSFVYAGYEILPFYDSMIAKITVHAQDRQSAIDKAIQSLIEIDIDGIEHNVDFQLEILLSEKFKNNTYTTSLVEDLRKAG